MTEDKDKPKDEPKDKPKDELKAKRKPMCVDCRMEQAAYTCAGCGRIVGHLCRLTHEAQGHMVTSGVKL